MKVLKIVGAKYRVLRNTKFFREGDKVTLVYDDGSVYPWFSGPIVARDQRRWFTPNGEVKEGDPGAVLCKPCHMDALELIEAPDYIAELEALRKENATLKAQLAAKATAAKKPAAKKLVKVGDRVRVELPSTEGWIRTAWTDGTYLVELDIFSQSLWLKPERLTRI